MISVVGNRLFLVGHLGFDDLTVFGDLEFVRRCVDQITLRRVEFFVGADERCMTDTAGIFTAGDCRTKAVRQVVTAVADGASAALAACRYLDR